MNCSVQASVKASVDANLLPQKLPWKFLWKYLPWKLSRFLGSFHSLHASFHGSNESFLRSRGCLHESFHRFHGNFHELPPKMQIVQVAPQTRVTRYEGYTYGVRRCAGAFFSREFRLAHHVCAGDNVRLVAPSFLLCAFRRRNKMCGLPFAVG